MEKAACYVEVNVNEEELFWVDKRTISTASGKLNKMIGKSSVTATPNKLKVRLHDLPGGAMVFELITRSLYGNEKTMITPRNSCLLHFAINFLEMEEDVALSNLMRQIEKSFEAILTWSWSDILVALKQCQEYYTLAESSDVFEKALESLVDRINSATETNPSNSSPESSALRFSCDTKSISSTKNCSHRAWWFEDVIVFSTDIMRKIIETMISQKIDQNTISRFLFYYVKARTSNVASIEKKKIIQAVISLLFSLDSSCISFKGLIGILQQSSCLNLTKFCRARLESMIGCQIDQATLDNILVPTPSGSGILYDVELVLRFLASFLNGGCTSVSRLKRVGCLMDLFLAEVAPDPGLKPKQFISLAMFLPDEARDSYDAVYQAVDIYLKVHAGLSEEQKADICCVMNYEKLSTETCKRLADNSKLPPKTALLAIISQQSKLKRLLQGGTTGHRKSSHHSAALREKDLNNEEQIVLYAKNFDLSAENKKLRLNLQGVQWKVMELEKICKKMQSQVAKISNTKSPGTRMTRSLPKLCS